MKATSLLALIITLIICLSLAVFALSGFNLLLFICFYSETAYRIILSAGGVSAAWLIFWVIAFKPFKNIS